MEVSTLWAALASDPQTVSLTVVALIGDTIFGSIAL
jgi:hypothetical protein